MGWAPCAEDTEGQGPGGRHVPRSTQLRMFDRGAKSWFYSCETSAQREKEKRKLWLSEILMRYKEQILKKFNLGGVLPYLVYDGVFSLKEYKEILSRDCYPKRVEYFFLKLFSKGPSALCAFCSHLEEFCPYLLTSLFLYYQGKNSLL
jgi:hypothetical protein